MADNKDLGHIAADDEIKRLEKEFSKVYSQAQKEVKAKLDDYLKRFAEEDYKKRVLLKAGSITQTEYQKWYYTKVFVGKQWQARLDAISADLVHANELAVNAINHALPEVFAENYNYSAYTIDGQTGMAMSWQLVDRLTVERLVKENPDLLPTVKDNIPKDERWNRQKITSAITQGIIHGEPISKIANRLRTVTDMNAASAVRNARTAVTGAECAGRVESYKAAEEKGVNLVQVWKATLDGRTRHSHAAIDGEERPRGKAFSNGCMYPGDPNGAGAEIYNCRCTILAHVKGYEKYHNQAEIMQKYGNGKLGNESYDEWKKRHIQALKNSGGNGLTSGAGGDIIKAGAQNNG